MLAYKINDKLSESLDFLHIISTRNKTFRKWFSYVFWLHLPWNSECEFSRIFMLQKVGILKWRCSLWNFDWHSLKRVKREQRDVFFFIFQWNASVCVWMCGCVYILDAFRISFIKIINMEEILVYNCYNH